MARVAADKASPSQADKFRDMARELEADEDEAAFEENVRKIAIAPKADKPKDQSA